MGRKYSMRYVKSVQHTNCNECGKEVNEVIELYDPHRGEEFNLCKECLSNAFGIACKVRILSIGEYSDHRVVGLFDECHTVQGEKIAEYIGGELEENPIRVNFVNMEEPPADRQFFHMQMYRNGDSVTIYSQPVLDYWRSRSDKISRNEESYQVYKEGSRVWRLYVRVYAKDEGHAAKIANEIRAQVLAGALPEKGSLP